MTTDNRIPGAAPAMAFDRFGRSYHLRIQSPADLERVPSLDPAHWVAISAPIASLNLDPVFLDLVDTDRNGRITSDEVVAAIRWLLATLQDRSGVADGSNVLRIDTVDEGDDGQRIRSSALKMLAQSGTPNAPEITLEQVRRVKTRVESSRVSEAGVVLPDATTDPDVRAFLADIIATAGGATHPSGREGVNEETLNAFLENARAYLAWRNKGVLPEGESKTDVMPLGKATPEAYALLAPLRDKLDQFFAQCEAVRFSGRAAAHLAPSDEELKATDMSEPAAIRALMARAPLAAPNAAGELSLDGDLNPFYGTALETLFARVLAPALACNGLDTLTHTHWEAVRARFAPHAAWVAAKPGATAETLGTARLEQWLAPGPGDAVRKLIATSRETALVLDNIRLTEKLTLYQAHMMTLVNNFVSFPYLYDSSRRASFEMGTLIMDGRRLNFAVRVANRSDHAAMARTSDIFVLYVEILPPAPEPSFEVAVPVTSGGKGNLCVGKRGVFIDVRGREYDARVVQIIENPISIREAMLAPFQRIGRALGGKIEQLTSTAEQRLDANTATSLAGAPAGGADAKASGSRGMLAGGLVMGGGVALAAVSSAIAYITSIVNGIGLLKILLGTSGAIIAVIAPASVLALMKLRRRDLSAVLEGAGWAINTRMRMTLRQGRFFANKPPYPADALGIRHPDARRLIVLLLILLATAIAWRLMQ